MNEGQDTLGPHTPHKTGIPVARFYVYEHWRPDTDQPFYVGKGTAGRAYKMGDKGNRNLHHRAIEKKLHNLGLAIEVKIIAAGLTDDDSYDLEMDLISFWRFAGAKLVNRTDGGDGVRNPPQETREKMRQLRLGTKASEETRAKMRAAQSVRAPQTPEQILKATRNRQAKRKPTTEETRIKMSIAAQKRFAKILSDPDSAATLRAMRSKSSKEMWARMKAEDPNRFSALQVSRVEACLRSWTPERRVKHAEAMRHLARPRKSPRAPFVGPRKRNTMKKDGPHGNKGKKMPLHVRELLAAHAGAMKGKTLPPETIDRMRKSWTPERRAKQALVGARSMAKRVRRKMTPAEAEANRLVNVGRKQSPETCAKMKAGWTPERRAAMAACTARRNTENAAKSNKLLYGSAV
jgi:hypothetical protein